MEKCFKIEMRLYKKGEFLPDNSVKMHECFYYGQGYIWVKEEYIVGNVALDFLAGSFNGEFIDFSLTSLRFGGVPARYHFKICNIEFMVNIAIYAQCTNGNGVQIDLIETIDNPVKISQIENDIKSVYALYNF